MKLTFVNKDEQKGATLVELLLYMGIFSILTAALFQLFSTILSTQLESQSTSSVLTDGQFIINRFNYDVKRAESVTSPSVGTQSGALTLLIDGVGNTYSLDNENLEIASGAAEAQINSLNTTISNLNFERLSDTNGRGEDTITISFTIDSSALYHGETQSRNFKTSIGLRPKR